MRLISKYGWIRTLHVATLRAKAFMRAPWAGGVVLLACVVAAMLLGVIDWIFPRGMNVEKLINDGLMVVFFFAVGLEIKREVVRGQLSSFRQAILPVVAAAGGMIAPAVVFTLFNHGTPAASGWGIPTATDIAFAVGILSMLERRIPVSLKIFLMALAVADDLGAILVIAFFYGGEVRLGCLVLALAIMLGVYAMKRLGEKRMAFYLVPAVAVWSLFYYSGVHSTISGVAMALLIPMEPRYGREYFVRKMRRLKGCFDGIETAGADFPDEAQRACLRRVGGLSTEAVGMSDRLEHALAPYVTFLVMPIFALANAGVVIESAAYFDIFHRAPGTGAVGMAGKPLGIFLASWCAVRTGLAAMPEGATWRMLLAVACLGGIGFTMSLFVDSLAFSDPGLVDRGKIAILMGSAAAALAGSLLIVLFGKKRIR